MKLCHHDVPVQIVVAGLEMRNACRSEPCVQNLQVKLLVKIDGANPANVQPLLWATPARTLFLPAITIHELHHRHRHVRRNKKSFKSCSTAFRQLRKQSLVGAPILFFSEADTAQETHAINVYPAPSAAIAKATPERVLRINGPHSTKGLMRGSLEQKWLRIMKSKEYIYICIRVYIYIRSDRGGHRLAVVTNNIYIYIYIA